jgi:hypothetical protein
MIKIKLIYVLISFINLVYYKYSAVVAQSWDSTDLIDLKMDRTNITIALFMPYNGLPITYPGFRQIDLNSDQAGVIANDASAEVPYITIVAIKG